MIKTIGLKLGSIAAVLVFQGTAIVDAYGLHGCPRHDALPVAGEPGTEDGQGHGRHGEQPGIGHGPVAHADAEEGGHEGPCTCVGTCAFGPNAPVAASLDATRFAAIAAALESAPAPHLPEELPGSPSFLLPYSQGPPPLA